jgi:hypothetical protein
MKNQSKLYANGFKPVFKVCTSENKALKEWRRLPNILKYTFNEEENYFNVNFSLQAPQDPTHLVYIAYSFPFSYTEMREKLDQI